MVLAEVRLYWREEFAVRIIAQWAPWDVDDPSVLNNVSPRPTSVQEVLRGLLPR